MIDLKDFRANPDRYRKGAADKGYDAALVDQLLEADAELRPLMTRQQELSAQKNKIGKQIGKLAGRLKKASESERAGLQEQMKDLQQRPSELKQEESSLADQITALRSKRDSIWLQLPMPADPDVPIGASDHDNVEVSSWHPDWFDPARSFEQNKGFAPRSHVELADRLGLVDFERGVKMAGTRSYVLTGHGMRLHQAILRYAFDYMTNENGFTPVSVPVVVREQMMVGTAFFPEGRDQAYQIGNPTVESHEQFLTGTGEVGLMGLHSDEILDEASLPRCYTTVSSCFRREAGAAGRDTAGLYRIHQFDKVEQVVICRADPYESRSWHQKMIGYVETLLRRIELPYRELWICTGDLDAPKADQYDIECWMPSRGPEGPSGSPTGAYGETHSASKLYDYQCRRLNLRYREAETAKPLPCHSLNNTVAASPRILIPILELYQNEDGTVTVPTVLRPYMDDVERIG